MNNDTFAGSGVSPFDRFFVPKGQPEFAASSQRIVSEFWKTIGITHQAYMERFSDHYMITTKIKIMADDD